MTKVRHMDPIARELRDTVLSSEPRLRAITGTAAERAPAPGKWSAKEILGHLVDSAANNHQRFVRAQFSDDLTFPGYEQDAWVRVQQYAAAPWDELVTLWQHYNLHLARIIDAVPHEIRMRLRERHNLDAIGWERVPPDQPATLDWFMRDYVRHLAHHLAQIFEHHPD